MFDDERALDLIEQAMSTDPFCPVCDAPTEIRDHDGRLWLECSTAAAVAPAGLRARLGASFTSHPRRLVLDLHEDLAA
jgi:hypothetical protein